MSADFSSVSEFIALLEKDFFCIRHGSHVFRGHSKKEYEIKPSVGRVKHTSKSFGKFESSIFSIFKRDALQFLTHQITNDFEWLALAQHCGLPTRLLDWSFNPLAALYFCVRSNENDDGEIICLNAEKKMPQEIYNMGKPFDIDKTYKFIPNSIARRIVVQEGLFTIHSCPTASLDKELRVDWSLKRVPVSAGAKKSLRYALFRMGIHEASLFPDIDGLSRHLHWRHSVDPTTERPVEDD